MKHKLLMASLFALPVTAADWCCCCWRTTDPEGRTAEQPHQPEHTGAAEQPLKQLGEKLKSKQGGSSIDEFIEPKKPTPLPDIVTNPLAPLPAVPASSTPTPPATRAENPGSTEFSKGGFERMPSGSEELSKKDITEFMSPAYASIRSDEPFLGSLRNKDIDALKKSAALFEDQLCDAIFDEHKKKQDGVGEYLCAVRISKNGKEIRGRTFRKNDLSWDRIENGDFKFNIEEKNRHLSKIKSGLKKWAELQQK